MIALAVDTSGPVAGVALATEETCLYEAVLRAGRTHSETLMPLLDAALRACAVKPAEVDVFACVAGPGSFTGVRIGVCAVKGLARAVEKPCLAVNALETLAYGRRGLVCPILDARRGQVYGAAFRDGERILPDRALPLGEFLESLPADEAALFTGDALTVHAAAICEALGERAIIAPAHMAYIRPAAACALALARREEWLGAGELLPIYLRKPQAEREREARETCPN